VLEVTGLVIAAKLAQRSFVELKQHRAQLLGRGITCGKTLPVNFTQGADQRVAVLVTDLAIVVAVAMIETWLAHAVLLCRPTREHPPAGSSWQPVHD